MLLVTIKVAQISRSVFQISGRNIGEPIARLHPTINLSSSWWLVFSFPGWRQIVHHLSILSCAFVGVMEIHQHVNVNEEVDHPWRVDPLVLIYVSGHLTVGIIKEVLTVLKISSNYVAVLFTTIPSQYYILWLFVTIQILNIAVLSRSDNKLG